MTLTTEDREVLEAFTVILEEKARRLSQRLFYTMFPDEDTPRPDWASGIVDHETIFARHKYEKHMEFFEAGATYMERCFMAANRIGKTMSAGGYELACHLTGEYPKWWKGRRFTRPIRAWAAGKTSQTTRDILQTTLLGDPVWKGKIKSFTGFGVIPGHAIGGATWASGSVTDLVDIIRIRHVTGGWSKLGFKSYNQGRGSFEGTAQHVILLDEECSQDIYSECLIRLMTTRGILMLTFTPLEGISDVVTQFLPEEMRPEIEEDVYQGQ